MDNTPTLADIIAEVAAWDAANQRTPGEFTSNEYAEQLGLDLDVARHKLAKWVREGRLNCRQVVAGRKVNYYSVK